MKIVFICIIQQAEPFWNDYKYEESHKTFLELRKEYNKFKAVYGSLCEDEFSALWTEEDKIIKTLIFYKNNEGFKSQKIVLGPTNYWDEEGVELMKNVNRAVEGIDAIMRPYIDWPQCNWLSVSLKSFFCRKKKHDI